MQCRITVFSSGQEELKEERGCLVYSRSLNSVRIEEDYLSWLQALESKGNVWILSVKECPKC